MILYEPVSVSRGFILEKLYWLAFRQEKRNCPLYTGDTQRQYLENVCSEDDLRSRIFGTIVVKFLACLPLLGFSNPPNGVIAHF